MWPFNNDGGERILVFPAGTVVKYGGLPCKLLHDTPYYSEHIREESTLETENNHD